MRRRGTRPRPRCRTIRGGGRRAPEARRRTRGAARARPRRSARTRGSRGSSAARAACLSGRGRVVADGGENRRREIGHRPARAQRGWSGGAAPRTRRTHGTAAQVSRWVSITAGVDARVLTIEAGRDRVTDVSAAHTGSVAYEGSGVPPVSSVAVDDLTRLWLEARDGDRTSLLQAIRASQADVWRLTLHLVGENEADDVDPGDVRAGLAGAARVPRRLERPYVAPRDRPARLRRLDPGRGAPAPPRPPGRATTRPTPARTRATTTGAHSLQALVDDLDRDQRVAFVLTQMVGCSYAEAAEICGVPVGTIRSRVARARERLVAEVGGRGDGVSSRVACRLRALVVVTLLVCGGIVIAAPPAYAHGVGGVQPRNYETKLLRVDAACRRRRAHGGRPGRQLAAAQHQSQRRAGARLRRRAVSPSRVRAACSRTYGHRRPTSTGRASPRASHPSRPTRRRKPVWRQVSSDSTATWHDHRVHFMGSSDPPEVQRDPSRSPRHRPVDRRSSAPTGVPCGHPASSSGCRHRHRGPTSRSRSWSRSGVFVLTRTRIWRSAFAVGLGLLAVCDLAHVAGLWDATTASTASKLGRERLFPRRDRAERCSRSLWMWRRDTDSAMPLILIAAIFLFVAGGLADVSTLGHSQIPTTFPYGGRPAPRHARPRAGRGSFRGRRVSLAPAPAGSAAPREQAEGSGAIPGHQLSSSHPSWSSGSTWIGRVRDVVRDRGASCA